MLVTVIVIVYPLQSCSDGVVENVLISVSRKMDSSVRVAYYMVIVISYSDIYASPAAVMVWWRMF